MTKSKMANRYSPEVGARAVRIVFEHPRSLTYTQAPIVSKIGCIRQTLRKWLKQAEKYGYVRDGVTIAERDLIKVPEREVRERRQGS